MVERRLVGGPLDGSSVSVPDSSEGAQLLVLVEGGWHAYRLSAGSSENPSLDYAGEVAELPRLVEDLDD